jgi:hypothetical protein
VIGRPSGPALLLGLVVAAVAVVLGAAVAVLDSPSEARRQRLDAQRVRDLSEIADGVDLYWTREGSLPPDLATLGGWQGFGEVPHDPESEAPYGYRVTGERTFELCAGFASDTVGGEPPMSWRSRPGYWHHPAGEHCYQLEAEGVER